MLIDKAIEQVYVTVVNVRYGVLGKVAKIVFFFSFHI